MNEFEQYRKLGESTDRFKKAQNWAIAIGLQAVDNLTPSKYLIERAKENIEGKITIECVQQDIATYYYQNPALTLKQKGEREADEVSARITILLDKDSFSFNPAEYISIHRFLFTGIFRQDIVGKVRDYDISKQEPILNGDSVFYSRANSIQEALDYDFGVEKDFDFRGLSQRKIAQHIAKFMADIWQIHPFGEGNTRTTAIFIIKYLRTLGFKANNDLFAQNAKYFRNALVRANYRNIPSGIYCEMGYLDRFFGNLLLGENNVLTCEGMQIPAGNEIINVSDEVLKRKDETVKVKDDTVNKGNETVKRGNDTVNPQNDTVKSKNDTVKSKNDTVKVGNDTVNRENDTVKAGNDTVNAGNDTVKRKNDTLNSKNDTVKVGNDTVNKENDTVKRKNDTVNGENDTVNGENDTVKGGNDTVKRENDTVKVKDDTVNDTVFSLINGDRQITAIKISQQLNISLSTAKREIKRLKDDGIIERIGSDKAGSWGVIRDDDDKGKKVNAT